MKRANLPRSVPLQRTGRKASLENQAKKLCRELVVIYRDSNTCQRCGQPGSRSQIQWCHIATRNAKSLVCVPWASLALCAGCHFYFDGVHRAEAREWWAEKWPDRALKLAAWRHGRPPKIDRAVEIIWLKQELQRLA